MCVCVCVHNVQYLRIERHVQYIWCMYVCVFVCVGGWLHCMYVCTCFCKCVCLCVYDTVTSVTTIEI